MQTSQLSCDGWLVSSFATRHHDCCKFKADPRRHHARNHRRVLRCLQCAWVRICRVRIRECAPDCTGKTWSRARTRKPLTVQYRGILVGSFRADLLVEDKVIVEIKVADHITALHERQTLNYLRASGIPVGLIFNFGPKAETRRMYWSEGRVRVEDKHG